MLRFILLALAALTLWLPPAGAQQRVDCGNGSWCPQGNRCLVGGQCGRELAMPKGAVELANGKFCDPGWHANRSSTACVPPGYVECDSGNVCPGPNAECAPGGGCLGGPPQTGPICGTNTERCSEGRICSRAGNCMNPAINQDCGTGSICSRAAACTLPSGCAYVAPERVAQQPWR